MDEKPAAGKPALHLLDPRTMTLDSLVSFYRNITGKEPTEEEVARLRERWAGIEADRARRRAARGDGAGGQ
jgi:hypothetical protein